MSVKLGRVADDKPLFLLYRPKTSHIHPSRLRVSVLKNPLSTVLQEGVLKLFSIFAELMNLKEPSLKILSQCGSWLAFILSLAAYLPTLEPGASYWDCPEYVVTATEMEVGHPPGNPVWMLTMRMATILAPAGKEAFVVNLMSAIFSALAAMLLFKVTFTAVYRFGKWRQSKASDGIKSAHLTYISFFSALCGSLCMAWCDSVWFSAVEAEVYSMSLFLSILTVWLMMRWRTSSYAARRRLVILTAYITGLSLGVHQLNLLVIPGLALMTVFFDNPDTSATKKAWLAIFLSFVTVGFILLAFMPLTLRLAGAAELFAVNTLGLPYFSGVTGFCALTIILFPLLAYLAAKARKPNIETAVWSAAMLWLGYCSFGIILIRGYASPPMNESAPKDIFALQSYIAREQYASHPLFYGPTPYSRPMLRETFPDSTGRPEYSRFVLEKGKAIYVPYSDGAAINPRSGMLTAADSADNSAVIAKRHGYILSDYRFTYRYTPEQNMILPRITSSKKDHLDAYEAWAGMNTENMKRVEVSEVVDTTGNPAGRIGHDGERRRNEGLRPTYLQNLRYFLCYQVGYMYFRYFMWNFSGRQNDLPSSGEVDHGNFITGIGFADRLMLGDGHLLPDEMWKENPGHNNYYMIPLLLGIAGIIHLCRGGRKGKRICAVIAMMYLMTGVAIVLYLNQTPGEPRERDYSFLGSYAAFCVWISFGAAAFSYAVAGIRHLPRRGAVATAVAAASLAVPAMMLSANLDDHDRSGRHATDDFARNVLESMPPEAILFVDGDNFTFPLWYAQETLGIRPDVTIVNTNYLVLPSYRITLMQPGKGSRPLRSAATPQLIIYGSYSHTTLGDTANPPVHPHEALAAMFAAPEKGARLDADRMWLPAPGGDSVFFSISEWVRADGGRRLDFQKLSVIDIIAANAADSSPRPVVFRSPVRKGLYSFLGTALRPHLFGDIYMPEASDTEIDSLMKSGIDRMRSGGFSIAESNGTKYCDPTIAYQLRKQRGAMIRAASKMLSDGNAEGAARTILKTLSLFPPNSCPMTLSIHAGRIEYEGHEAGSVLEQAGKVLERPDLVKKGEQLKAEQEKLAGKLKRYRKSLPPYLRDAVSFETIRLSAYPEATEKQKMKNERH